MFAKIENETVTEWPIANITMVFPNTSFPSPLTAAALPDGYVMVGALPPPEPGPNQKVIPGQPVKQGTQWVQSWDVVSMTPSEVEERNVAKAHEHRAQRNQLLAQSDWTQVADAPVDRAAWATYRQALRDISAQPGFPLSVTWPSAPA